MKRSLTLILPVIFTISVYSNVCSAQTPDGVEIESIDKMIRTVETIQRELNRCESELCDTVMKNAGARMGYFLKAKKAFGEGNTEMGFEAIEEAHEIIKGDIKRLSVDRLPMKGLQNVLRYEKDLNQQVETQLRKRPGRAKW